MIRRSDQCSEFLARVKSREQIGTAWSCHQLNFVNGMMPDGVKFHFLYNVINLDGKILIFYLIGMVTVKLRPST